MDAQRIKWALSHFASKSAAQYPDDKSMRLTFFVALLSGAIEEDDKQLSDALFGLTKDTPPQNQ